MNKSEKTRLLDEKLKWFLKSSTTDQDIEFDSYDGIKQKVMREKRHWKQLEDATPQKTLFSEILVEVQAFLEHVLDNVDENNIQNIQGIVQNFDTTSISVSCGNGRRRNGYYGSYIEISVPCIILDEQNTEYVDYAYKQLYLSGKLKDFEELCSLILGRSNLSNMLNSQEETQVAIAVQYLGLLMRKYAYPTQNQFNKARLASLDNDIEVVSERLDGLRKEAEEFIDEKNKTLNSELEALKSENEAYIQSIQELKADEESEFERLKKTYEENLRLKAPVKYWEEAAKRKEKSFRRWLVITSAVSLLLVGFVACMFCLFYSQSEGTRSQLIPLSFVVVALIAVLIYAVKTLVKITMAERHLGTEFDEKAMFTHFYLSLLQNEGAVVDEKERLLIYDAIFAHVDTGLIRNQSDGGIGAAELVRSVAQK